MCTPDLSVAVWPSANVLLQLVFWGVSAPFSTYGLGCVSLEKSIVTLPEQSGVLRVEGGRVGLANGWLGEGRAAGKQVPQY